MTSLTDSVPHFMTWCAFLPLVFYASHRNFCFYFIVTKAEDKIKNIKEAMEVFENWLEENGGGSSNKNSKVDSNDKVDTVPGLGFKDKEAAEKTLK